MNLSWDTFLFCIIQQMGDWAPNWKRQIQQWLLLALSGSLRTRSFSTALHCPLKCFSHPKRCKRDQLDSLWAHVNSSGLEFCFPSSFRGELHRSIRVITSLPKIQRSMQAWICLDPLLYPSLSPHPSPYPYCGTIAVRTFSHLLRLGSTHGTSGGGQLQCLLSWSHPSLLLSRPDTLPPLHSAQSQNVCLPSSAVRSAIPFLLLGGGKGRWAPCNWIGLWFVFSPHVYICHM